MSGGPSVSAKRRENPSNSTYGDERGCNVDLEERGEEIVLLVTELGVTNSIICDSVEDGVDPQG